jgi:CRP/FNR family transcriptional regulator, cyclic AMP receptor protein
MAVKTEKLLDSSDVTKKNIDFQKDEIIFSQGDPAKDVFYLRKGLVRLSVTSNTGKEGILEMLRPGDFFGTWCLADHPLRMATATALEQTTVCTIGKSQMLHMLNADQELSGVLISCLLDKNMRIAQDLANLLLNSAEKRLARKLLLLSQFGTRDKTGTTLPKAVTQRLLAGMIGITRERVNFIMNKFRRLGFVDYNGVLKIRHSLLLFALEQ